MGNLVASPERGAATDLPNTADLLSLSPAPSLVAADRAESGGATLPAPNARPIAPGRRARAARAERTARDPLTPGRHRTGTTDARIDAAVRFAVDAHAGQNRRDRRTPYIVHPLAVMRHLSTDLGVDDRDVLAASLLHDAVEEAGVEPQEIARRFGPRTSRLVEELTIPPEFRGEGVPESKKTEILLHVAGRMTWDALLIKLAERWDNLGDMVGNPWQPGKRGAYIQQTGEFVEAIQRRWDQTPPPPKLRAALSKSLKALQGRLIL